MTDKALDTLLPVELCNRGIDLSTVGVNNYGWKAHDAMQVIDALEHTVRLIQGGDVWAIRDGTPVPSYENWYFRGDEEAPDAVSSAATAARQFIQGHIDAGDDASLFEIVTRP